MIDGVLVTPLNIIDVQGGAVLHGLKNTEPGYVGFGEAYFSTCHKGAIKAWKRHRSMTLNLIVPVGAIRFVLYDDRPHSVTRNVFQEAVLSREQYTRLTVPPMIWLGFQGLAVDPNVLLNIADLVHDPDEVDRLAITDFDFEWGTF